MALTKALGGSGGGGGGSITVKDEGSTLTTALTSLNVVSPNLTATNASGDVTLTGIGVGVTADDQPASPNAADDEFESAALDTGGTRRSGATAWAWVNQGTSTATQKYGSIGIAIPTSSGDNARLVVQSLPAGAWTYEAKLRAARWLGVNFMATGLVLRESATAKMESIGWHWNTNLAVAHQRWTALGTVSSTPNRQLVNGFPNAPLYLRVSRDGSNNLLLEYSFDRITWYAPTSPAWAQTTAFTTAPDQVGLIANINNTTVPLSVAFDWFRRTA